MGKKFISAFAKAQANLLSAKDNKERLQHMIAKIEDGIIYDAKGKAMGNYEGEDATFITDADLELSRITQVKIQKIKESMLNYFNADTETVDEARQAEEDEEIKDVVTDDVVTDDVVTDDVDEDLFDEEAVVEAFNKAVKKGKIKKARKLLDKLSENDYPKTKKLEKKLSKVGE